MPRNAPLLFVSAASGYGGAERSIEIMLRRLPADMDVGILAESELHLRLLRAIARPRTTIVPVETSDDASFRKAVRTFNALYRRLRPQAVLANTHMSAKIVAGAATTLPGIDARAFLYLRDFLWFDAEWILGRLPRATILVPDGFVLERPGYVDRFLAADTGRRSAVVPDMVEMPDRCPEPPAEDARFLHLATVNAWKGHDHLIRAMAHLRAKGSKARLLSVGHRPYRQRFDALLQEVEANGLLDSFEFRDLVADPGPLLRACRAVVVASVSHSGGPETFGRTIIEAWSYGRPVIAFAAGAPARLIRHGIDGLLVPEGDEVAMAEAMARLDGDASLCAQLGQNGWERARREFKAGHVVKRLLGLLAETPPRIGRLDAIASRFVRNGRKAVAPSEEEQPIDPDGLRLLGACLAGPSATTGHALRAELAERGYDGLFSFAGELRIAPLLVESLRERMLVPPVPAMTFPDGRKTVARVIELIEAEHRERRAVLTRHLTGIAAAMNARGLVPVLIKGARSLWLEHPRWRTLRDFDLVLEGKDADAGQAVLLALGYRPLDNAADRPRRHHLTPLFRRDLPGWIEVHRRAGNRYAEPLLPTGELLAESREVVHDGARVRVLSGVHHVLHSLVHHHFGHSGFARGTLDIKGLIEFHRDLADLDESEKQALLDRASDHPLLLGTLDLWLAAAADLLDAKIGPPFKLHSDAGARWQAMRARMTGETKAQSKYPGYAEEIRIGLSGRRVRQAYPRLGPLAAVPAAVDVARCLLPKLPL